MSWCLLYRLQRAGLVKDHREVCVIIFHLLYDIFSFLRDGDRFACVPFTRAMKDSADFYERQGRLRELLVSKEKPFGWIVRQNILVFSRFHIFGSGRRDWWFYQQRWVQRREEQVVNFDPKKVAIVLLFRFGETLFELCEGMVKQRTCHTNYAPALAVLRFQFLNFRLFVIHAIICAIRQTFWKFIFNQTRLRAAWLPLGEIPGLHRAWACPCHAGTACGARSVFKRLIFCWLKKLCFFS